MRHRRSNNFLIHVSVAILVWLSATAVFGALPEPPRLLYGTATRDAVQVLSSDDVTIVAYADIDLDPPGPSPEDRTHQLVGQYHMGDQPELDALNYYALQIKLEASVGDHTLSTDAALIDAAVRIYIRDGDDVQTEQLAHEFTVSAVGTIERIDLVASSSSVPEPLQGTGEIAKTNRYLRFIAPSPTVGGTPQEVVRVRITSLDGFAVPSPDVLYVGPPFAAPDPNAVQADLTFTAARLQCEPYAHAWADEGIVSAHGTEIIPSSTYDLQRASSDCPNLEIDESCWSPPLTIATAKFADAVAPFYTNPGDVQPDFKDVTALIQKFLFAPTAPIKAVVQVQPNTVHPERPVSLNDLAAYVQAFLGRAYVDVFFRPTGPCVCPSTVTCGATMCDRDSNYPDYRDLCISGFCTDACGRCSP